MELKQKRHLVVVDTSAVLADGEAIPNFLSEEGNLLVIPLTVSKELDNKKDHPSLGSLARLAINCINEQVFSDSTKLVVEKGMLFEGLNLERDKNDFQILATFNYILHSDIYAGYQKYELVTLDNNMRIIAYCLFKHNPLVSIEDYRANLIVPKKPQQLPVISMIDKEISFDFNEEAFGEISENGGVLIDAGPKNEVGAFSNTLLAVRKGEKMKTISADTEMFGLKAPYVKDGETKMNWEQLLAFHLLLDKGIQCVFLHGPAGTGKTLLAIAAGLLQRKDFEQLILVNPMVSLSNQTKMGFLPGDQKAKITPWMAPFEQNIRFLERKCSHHMTQALNEKKGNGHGASNGNGNNTSVGRAKQKATYPDNFFDNQDDPLSIWEKYGFTFQSLEYIRGQTITNAWIIFEEAQNLSQHEMKTIVTRAGEGTKIIFCGDLSQIDLPYLNVRNSGLTYAIETLIGTGEKNKMVASCGLKVTRRSKLAAFASEVM